MVPYLERSVDRLFAAPDGCFPYREDDWLATEGITQNMEKDCFPDTGWVLHLPILGIGAERRKADAMDATGIAMVVKHYGFHYIRASDMETLSVAAFYNG